MAQLPAGKATKLRATHDAQRWGAGSTNNRAKACAGASAVPRLRPGHVVIYYTRTRSHALRFVVLLLFLSFLSLSFPFPFLGGPL